MTELALISATQAVSAQLVTAQAPWFILHAFELMICLGLLLLGGLVVWGSAKRPAEDHPDEGFPEEGTTLAQFLRTPSAPTFVAVPQRGNTFGDIRDKKARSLEGPSIGGQGLLSAVGLGEDPAFPPLPPALTHPSDRFRHISYLQDTPDEEEQTHHHDEGLQHEGLPAFRKNTEQLAIEVHSDEDEAHDASKTSRDEKPGAYSNPPWFNSPTKDNAKGPWWKELLASPVKKFKISDWSWASPSSAPRDQVEPKRKPRSKTDAQGKSKPPAVPRDQHEGISLNDTTAALAGIRKDVPPRYSLSKMKTQTKFWQALSTQKVAKAVENIERDYYATSSKKTKIAKQNTVHKVLDKAGLGLPLSTMALKVIAGVLKSAGYRSGSAYLVEAKMMHIEAGHVWYPCLRDTSSFASLRRSVALALRRKLSKYQRLNGLLAAFSRTKTTTRRLQHLASCLLVGLTGCSGNWR